VTTDEYLKRHCRYWLADIAISNTVMDAERTQLAQSANSIRIG
jgi:hypothetical protein